MEAIALKQKSSKLEKEIQRLIDDFIKDVGDCNIKVEAHTILYDELNNGKNIIVGIPVSIKITI